MAGSLVLVGTPLGNRSDLSPRAHQAILQADELWCEDTRSPLRLMGEGVLLPPRKSCFAGNEDRRCEELKLCLAEGKKIVFVSEAGMPAISDPGQGLAQSAWAAGAKVEVIPGPTAAMTALVASGFAAQGAVFWGFLPRKGGRRDALMAKMAASEGAFILYEAGNRVKALLRELDVALAEQSTSRRLLIGRELTKKHETLQRGSVRDLLQELAQIDERGEFTLVLEGAGPAKETVVDPRRQGAQELWSLLQQKKLRPKARAREIAALLGENARDIYACLVNKGDSN